MTVLTCIGVVASLIGAGVSIKQANKAKKIKEEIILDRSKRSFINPLGEFRNTRKESNKLVSIQNGAVQGIDESVVLDSIQSSIDKLYENSHRKNFDKISNLIKATRDLVHRYRTGDGNKENLAEGIHRKVNEITREISRQIDAIE